MPNGTPFNALDSKEYVFIYDISKYTPVKKQVVQIPPPTAGIVLSLIHQSLFLTVSGGLGDFPLTCQGR